MKTLIVYDSLYGNTEKVARTISDTIKNARLKVVKDVTTADLQALDLLIVGSPTQGGRPTAALQQFLKDLSVKQVKGVRVATFDTRFAINNHGLGLKVLMSVIRFAAEKVAGELKNKGGKLVGAPTGFVVTGKEGPLQEGELKRAQAWAREVVNYG
jgi:flavodoxin I